MHTGKVGSTPPDWPQGVALPWFVLVVGSILAVGAGLLQQKALDRGAEALFQRNVDRVALEVQRRLAQPVRGLRGVAGLYAATPRVQREQFSAFVMSRDMDMDFPGVSGFGFVQRTSRSSADAFVPTASLGGASDLGATRVADDPQGDLYVTTDFEPAPAGDGWLGTDLGADPRLRSALQRAVDSGDAAISGRVSLPHQGQAMPGVVLLLPVYRRGATLQNVQARRQALTGLLMAPLRTDVLLADVFEVKADRLNFELLEPTRAAGTDTSIFDSRQESMLRVASMGRPAHAEGRFVASMPLTVFGRTLGLRVRSTPAFDASESSRAPLTAAVLGVLAAAALAALLRNQAAGRSQAEQLARAMTTDLDRLALVARNTNNAVVITDVNRRITWVNAAFEQVTGYTASEAHGRSPGDLLQFEATDALSIARMRSALDDGRPFSGTLLNRAKNGRVYWIEVEIQPMRDGDGRLSGFMAIETDITERKNAEASLRASQSFLDNTGRIGGVGGWDYDVQTGRMQWTDQTCRILDHEPGHRPTLRDWLDCCAPEAHSRVLQALDRGNESASVSDVELPFVTHKGRSIWVRLVAEGEYSDGGKMRIVGALQDITARRAMEAEVQRNAELLRGAIATIDEAFVVYDPDDRIVFFNDKYREVYALSSDLIQLGARFEDIVRTGAQRGQYAAAEGRVEAWVSERVAQHRAGNTKIEQQLDDGRWMRIIERHTPDGHIVGFRVDITDLVRATEAAEQANRTKSEFIATVSHELRTPLQSIIGFSELGQHFAAGQAQFLPMFTDILAGGRRMLTLVNGLLDASKLEGSGGALSPRRSDLAVLAAHVVHELRHLAAERDLRVEGPTLAIPLLADLDPFRIQQVLRNVLANAIRFAPAGSLIELAGRPTVDHGVLLTIRDHGPGIPPSELETIFDPFVQSSRTRDGSGGTGLGLTICRKIMRAHGGRIEAANANGGGAVMVLWLPAAATDLQAAADAATPVQPAAPRKALLTSDIAIEA